LRIVANCARNDRRARGRRARLAVRAAGQRVTVASSPEEHAVAEDDAARVIAAMNRLSELDRLVLTLRHMDGLSEAETATVLDCPPGTVKSRVSRALERLRRELGEEEDDA
jgi:RNA polymerase sigma-70 factor (ECF subfamily)